MRNGRIAALAGVCAGLSGCAGHFVVRPVTQASDPGIRYYLPVPYLAVTNMQIAGSATTAGTGEGKPTAGAGDGKPAKAAEADAGGEGGGEVVSAKVIWLPDMATPYAITTKGGGIGTFKGGVQLADGWMLTGMNEESDAKVAETLSALSGVVKSGAGAATAAFAPRVSRQAASAPFLLFFRIDTKANTLTPVDSGALKTALAEAMGGAKP